MDTGPSVFGGVLHSEFEAREPVGEGLEPVEECLAPVGDVGIDIVANTLGEGKAVWPKTTGATAGPTFIALIEDISEIACVSAATAGAATLGAATLGEI